MPWLDRWAIYGRPVTAEDLRRQLRRHAATMAALDPAVAAAGVRDDIWHPGLSATTLVPRATALAHHFGHWADAHT